MIGSDVLGREILRPLAVTIFGGLISETLLDAALTLLLFLKFSEAPLKQTCQSYDQSHEEREADVTASQLSY